MLKAPARRLDLELRAGIHDLQGLDEFCGVRLLVRLDGIPVGCTDLAVVGGVVSADAIRSAVACDCGRRIALEILRRALSSTPHRNTVRPDARADLEPRNRTSGDADPLRVTVAVCTRDRSDRLARCLESLENLDYPELEILVVDNAPRDASTQSLIAERFPRVRYVCEPRPGLDYARNRAFRSAGGDVVAYTDDDATVDSAWVAALARVFCEDDRVEAVTGLVFAADLATEAQVLFETYGGFGRGYQRLWFGKATAGNKLARAAQIGAGGFGTGANMAFRRSALERLGGFDPALDVGTRTCGGGDLDMFFRVIEEGGVLVYEPAAVVYHEHRRTRAELRDQLRNHGRGFYAHLTAVACKYPSARRDILRFGLWWLIRWNLLRLLRPSGIPRALVFAELTGSLEGPFLYRRARADAERVVAEDDPQADSGESGGRSLRGRNDAPVAIRSVDLADGLRAVDDAGDHASVALRISYGSALAGVVTIDNDYGDVSRGRLLDACVKTCEERLFDPPASSATAGRRRGRELVDEILGARAAQQEQSPDDPYVSIVIATRGRPADLERCLTSIAAQAADFSYEVIVVDNAPGGSVTPEIVARFAGARLIDERRPGLSYARNRGVVAARGRIIVATDDDVVVADGWLQNLVAPFERAEVSAVTGNVLPLELETPAQRAFEAYGGLGRGFDEKEYGPYWDALYAWQAVPTWEIGATANAAFRASVFRDPRVGLFEETLGAGMPPGVGEDTYLFYRLLRRGGTIVYRPQALVFHKHRRSDAEFRRQLFDYSSGHVGYHLTTLIRDGDRRALRRIVFGLPFAHIWRIAMRLSGRSDYPLRWIAVEAAGNLTGPVALWRAYRRVARLGRSSFDDSLPRTRTAEGRAAQPAAHVAGRPG